MIGAGVRSGVLLKMFGLCVLAGVLVAALLLPMATGAGAMVNQTTDAMSKMSSSLARQDMPQVSTVTDKDGAPIAYFFDDYRVETRSDEISEYMKAAITAVEDKRFWDHGGVDWHGTMRALATNLSSGEASQGASTITQQYVKNYLVHVVAGSDNPIEAEKAKETTIARKLREAKIAVELERTMTKEEILTGYLNVVPFGNQTFGVGAASQTYFGTTPDKLTIAQSALLAAIVNAPGSLNPNSNPEDAKRRRDLVIDLMTDPTNNKFITKEDAERAKQEPLNTLSPLGRPPNGCVGVGDGTTDGFFCTYVVDYLDNLGIDRKMLKTGGYTIRTTLDRKSTEAAKAAAEAQVPTQTEGIANAMAVVEPGQEKHKVRALVANRDFGNDASKGQTAYDIVSRVQPFGAGSVYKVFTAAAAIEQGMSIHDVIDVPASYTSRVYRNGNAPYTVSNADGVTPGPRTLQMALATSPNTAFVALSERAGLDNVVDMAARLGLRRGMNGVNTSGQILKSDGSNGPSQAEAIKNGNRGAFTLGYTPTSVLELSNVGATIMSGGMYCPPTPIEEIKDRLGNPVPLKEAKCERAVSPEVAAALAQGMSKDDTDGTSRMAAQEAGWTRPMIGKTGTTQAHQSAAFLAATPQMSGAVLTYSDGRIPQGICDGGGNEPPRLCGKNGGNIYGGKVPARTWFAAMNRIHEGLPVAPLP
ncbi:Membrane carboxypeptidase (penicillin-binding protein) [Saccharopolyspora kobensis]|uniref:Membrane carboxypeptidase (Penicillin-binding protein) n=2 Tax=Saccharopolyspora kobensis TaxID=146035 RepID=A0A1H6EJU7_9PSEU|nr:Membrane carboxypeptidase (penicillin-binding protein) [Saccharopolyspora kobensis]SFE67088.1 Membrane carboxypeptidase (penicillin-binding protein) [Saccharopolyspora kobensis]